MREEAYRRARRANGMETGLESLIETYEDVRLKGASRNIIGASEADANR